LGDKALRDRLVDHPGGGIGGLLDSPTDRPPRLELLVGVLNSLHGEHLLLGTEGGLRRVHRAQNLGRALKGAREAVEE
jgi:hypothetical protein